MLHSVSSHFSENRLSMALRSASFGRALQAARPEQAQHIIGMAVDLVADDFVDIGRQACEIGHL
ncbi:MAG: hypothetical protein GTN60_10530, partial [Pseudomonas stutzeri]|nr:hypothetical protein [Stutzerimonas stutzeri]NIN81127.1 hypothetical protein [Stutzerimonas stutzeri]NIP01099.1 hypothetical protein [Stutzerimonas stutzeri]